MTCIVGLVDQGKVYIGADSASVDVARLHLVVRNDRKVFRAGNFLIGFTTSWRMGQLLAYKLAPPMPRLDQDVMHYMVNDFTDAVRQVFKDGGFAKVSEGRENRRRVSCRLSRPIVPSRVRLSDRRAQRRLRCMRLRRPDRARVVACDGWSPTGRAREHGAVGRRDLQRRRSIALPH